ncbi:xanthine dehydrogenase/oxidase [Pelomyxa schiedti]|nr:xanthine dehydrogenase/oxidase [Pelomyxa schiedti]
MEVTNRLLFGVNGRLVEVDAAELDLSWTLSNFLRRDLPQKRATRSVKEGCGQGNCGTCTVILSYCESDGKPVHRAVKSCLIPLAAVDGMMVTTSEGLGGTRGGLHPIQERLARNHGTQCGFCSAGMVMSIYGLLVRNATPSVPDIEEALQGNLCRCTGYRPVVDVATSFTANPVIIVPPTIPPELTARLNPKNKSLCPLLAICSASGRKQWFSPLNLAQITELRATYPLSHIVGGGANFTHNGILPALCNGDSNVVFVQVGRVAEMKSVIAQEGNLVVGASVALADLVSSLDTTASEKPNTPLSQLHKCCTHIANYAARNTITLGGIVCNDAYSDILPLLSSLEATALVIVPKPLQELQVRIQDVVATLKEHKGAFLVTVRIPLGSPSTLKRLVGSYRMSRTMYNDKSMIGASFVIDLSPENIVKHCSFFFGCPEHRLLEVDSIKSSLVGSCWNDSVVPNVLNSLELWAKAIFPAPSPLPPVSTETALTCFQVYKHQLVLNLFRKFYLETTTNLAVEIKTPSTMTFSQVFDRTTDTGVLGTDLPHLSASFHTTGEAVYLADMYLPNNVLYAALVMSTKARARMLSIDAAPALSMPGVVKFVSAKDIVGSNVFYYDMEVFADKEVHCVGHIIGLVLAKTPEQAKMAAPMVKIEYEELEPILTINDAIKANSYLCKEYVLERGSVNVEAPIILEGSVFLGGQEHFYLEPHVASAFPQEGGSILVKATTQHPDKTQVSVAKVLGLKESQVTVTVKRLGGSFGGKECTYFLPCCVAVAAQAANTPVILQLDRDTDMQVTGGRHPFQAKYRAGCTPDGKILFVDWKVHSDGGHRIPYSTTVLTRALLHMDSCYWIPNFRVVGRACRTNTTSNSAMRGFGVPQAIYCAEILMEHIARTVGFTVERVRELNLYEAGQTTPYNQLVEYNTIRRIWAQLKRESNYEAREHEIALFNANNKFIKRGISITPMKHGLSFEVQFLNQANALVNLYVDGTCIISHSGIEMGQGLNTKVAQIASYVLGIPVASITVTETDTSRTPNIIPTAASAGTDLVGGAVLKACEELNVRLQPFKEQLRGKPFAAVCDAAYKNRVSLSCAGHYATPNVGYDFETHTGKGFNYFCFGAAVTEVEIEVLTGRTQVLRADLLYDAGKSLNPGIDIGQVEGCFVQGLGEFLMEEIVRDSKGNMVTRNAQTYKIPSVYDIPMDFRVALLSNPDPSPAVFSSRGIGEPPLGMAASASFAVRHAVIAARRDRSGIPSESIDSFSLNAPCTPVAILLAINN